MESWKESWQAELELAGCEQCDWIFMLPPQRLPLACPHCAQTELVPLDATADQPVYVRPPEQVLPFQQSPAQAGKTLQTFAKKAVLAPKDLKGDLLVDRLQLLFLPMWLVDADVRAQWQAEMGFDYEIVSHEETFRNDRWHTREVKQTRQRWEPRLGTLRRHYANRLAPALEEQSAIEQQLGKFDPKRATAYQAQAIDNVLVRLPNRSQEDAWPEAVVALKRAAAAECQAAAGADHLRQFKWQPDYPETNWTQLLYPIYTSYYQDDEQETHILYIHGQNGRLSGTQRASMKRARHYAITLALIAGALFVLTLLSLLIGFFYSELLSLAGILFLAGMGTGVAALLPVLYAWLHNRSTRASGLDLRQAGR